MKKITILLTLALVVGSFLTNVEAATNSAPPVISNGLLGLWHLDGTANDSSVNGRHGTIVGATSTTGKFGQSYNFNGSSYIDVGDMSFPSNQLTVNGWVRTSVPAVTEVWRMWISKLNGSTGGPIEFFLGDGRPDQGHNGPCFFGWNGGVSVNGPLTHPWIPKLLKPSRSLLETFGIQQEFRSDPIAWWKKHGVPDAILPESLQRHLRYTMKTGRQPAYYLKPAFEHFGVHPETGERN